MAGEVRGKIYEAITRLALEKAILENSKGWRVIFHEQPEWVSIEADLGVGRDKDNLEALVLVTHSTSVKLYEKKFWRNFAELFQYKIQGGQAVRCYSIIFDAHVKPELKKVSDAFIDGSIEVGLLEKGFEAMEFVENNKSRMGKSDKERLERVKQYIDPNAENYHAELHVHVEAFGRALSDILEEEKHDLQKLWSLLQAVDRRHFDVPSVKETNVKNGIAKLLILDDGFRSRVLDSIINQTELDEPVPAYAVDLGFVEEDLSAYRVEDLDILSVTRLLGGEVCNQLVGKAPKRMQDFADPLRSVGNLEVYSAFVAENFDVLSKASGMKGALEECFLDPVGLLPESADFNLSPRDTWLFVYCMTLEKAEKGKVLGYGLSDLARETGFPSIGGADGGLKISPFIYRQEKLPDVMMDSIAKVFSDKIKRIGKKKLASKEFVRSMKQMLVQRQRYILMVYRFFDPIGDLITTRLDLEQISWSKEYVSTCLREYSGAKAAKSQFLKLPAGVLIYWQTVTEAGRIHKVKELSARFRATKVMWNESKFVLRPEAQHIFFVADGNWRNDDFHMLMRSGVDGVFYPDQMDQLMAAVRQVMP